MAFRPFTKDYTDREDQAFRSGIRPGENARLGPNQSAITNPRDFANKFVNLRFNPDAKANLWNSNVFPADVAAASQNKINAAAATDYPAFAGPEDNKFAWDFLQKYSGPGGAIERGLIEPERAVTKEMLDRLTTQPATFGTSQRDPNTVSKFPGESGISAS